MFDQKFQHRPHGFTVTELVVAAGLLVTGMSAVMTLAVSGSRIGQETRHYRLAIEELSNVLENLTALDETARTELLKELSPSAQLQAMLPNPRLSAERLQDGQGDRIVLRLAWDRLGKDRPVVLVGWVDPLPVTSVANEQEVQP